jgi:hypothetical protein
VSLYKTFLKVRIATNHTYKRVVAKQNVPNKKRHCIGMPNLDPLVYVSCQFDKELFGTRCVATTFLLNLVLVCTTLKQCTSQEFSGNGAI